jgi:hypothetical protein
MGLLPAALSSGIGSQVQKPLAVVVVGGMVFAPFLILIVLPVLVHTFSRRRALHPGALATTAPTVHEPAEEAAQPSARSLSRPSGRCKQSRTRCASKIVSDRSTSLRSRNVNVALELMM